MIKDEKGQVVVEASIVLTITVVFITVLIYLGFFIYQYTNLQIVANETATNVAQVYATEYKDPIYGYVSEAEFYKTDLYRNLTNVFTKSLDKTNSRKAEWLSKYRLKKSSMLDFPDPEITVDVVRKPGKLIQKQIEITISQKMNLPFSAVWGSNSSATVVVKGRADCLDLLEYFNMVDTAKSVYDIFGIDKATALIPKVDKWVKSFNKLFSGKG